MKNSSQSFSALIDLCFVLATLFILKFALLQLPAMWTYAGPISLFSALAVATWRLRCAGESWKILGFVNDQGRLRLVLWTVGALVVTVVFGNIASYATEQFLVTPSAGNNDLSQAMSGRFANLQGNPPEFIFWLSIAWIIGGFTEELLFRGFLIHRFEKLYLKFPLTIGLSILSQALIFGQQHYYYQGLAGFAATGMIALLSGIIYLLLKRRLWPLILSHGLANTLGLSMIFLGIGG